ncbi:MAG: type II toxin-antitoxin system RelE/ParE family toxin [Sulfuricurvum sp.]|jgi:mRNA interferase RelE/StbE|uniref:type II toxin-antitoxin system RelE family toxin n=1 Tax=Sulfuricurvum sp. TaxID=2025608 RepID=UPI0025E36DED|nr:type II toxin-antitoxin system RelE/ParE family toxin [Sulfuricurvum sp.]MCK9372374.1 type II toxin-antitoxin system RelE/ParE family toxin [Sulfuricurvum sp.]
MYLIEFFPEVEDDLRALDHRVRLLVFKQLNKLAHSPQLGDLLGNKSGMDLSGCRKMYVDHKRVRIVYRILEEVIIVEVIAIAARDEMAVYREAAQRIK